MMLFERGLNKFSSNPKHLFLLDGIGAMLSVFMLGFVLVKLENFFGIPKTTLYILAFFPIIFAVFDFFCFNKVTKNVGNYLKAIAFANVTYIFISIGLAIYHVKEITYLGWAYLIIEILIIIYLVVLELRIGLVHKNPPTI